MREYEVGSRSVVQLMRELEDRRWMEEMRPVLPWLLCLLALVALFVKFGV